MRRIATIHASLLLAIAAAGPTGIAVAQHATADIRPVPPRGGVREEVAERVSTRESHLRRASRADGRPIVGVVLAPSDSAGVSIVGVTPGSPAAAAGLRSGDRLVAVDGRALLGSNGALRADNARRLLGDLRTDRPVRLAVERDGKRREVELTPRAGDQVVVWVDDTGREITTRGGVAGPVPGVAPRIRLEVDRLRGGDTPALLEAFRWNGLNLASMGPELGRYFGTNTGVLVLSTGEALSTLEPGDVIRKVGDTRVETPRAAMEALRGLPAGSAVTLDVLRERKALRPRITVPAALPALPLAPPAPPRPPAPPAPPRPPRTAAPGAPPAPPATPAPPAPAAPPAPPAPPPPSVFVS